jgi:hypothetical protein
MGDCPHKTHQEIVVNRTGQQHFHLGPSDLPGREEVLVRLIEPDPPEEESE